MESTKLVKIEKEMHLMDFIREGAKKAYNMPVTIHVLVTNPRFWYKNQFGVIFKVVDESINEYRVLFDNSTDNSWLIHKSDCIVISEQQPTN